jgi:tetratricopeptide (TPR) repeat protein
MNRRIIAWIFIGGCCTSLSGFTPEQMRNYFEWGEYPSLIDTLESYFATAPDTLDSTVRALYHCYLGVAYFGKGKIGEARKQFLSALRYDRTIRPDRAYISEEIDNLFVATHADYLQERSRIRIKDSLLIEKQQVFNKNLTAIKVEEMRKSKRSNTVIALSLFVVGAAFSGIAAYEYYSTKQPYREFKAAAREGDRATYERLQPTIKRANTIITGCAAAAGIAETVGIIFTIRVFSLRRHR